MDLTPRKQAVLKAVVKAYIETGEPIGSKNLAALLENAPSSATLRNEMSELCELGLLRQPHTSAGRVPTSDGYRFYVDSLIKHSVPPKETALFIESSLKRINCEPDGIPAAAAQMLSRLIGLPAISCLITENPSEVKRIETLYLSGFSVMLLLITGDGRTRSRIVRNAGGYTPELKRAFKDIAERRIKGRRINELHKAYLQNVIAEAGIYSLELSPLLAAVFETAQEIEETSLTVKGENALYNICETESDARRILSLINRREPIISLLEGIDGSVGTLFGADTGYGELMQNAVIAAKFKCKDKYRGYIGVIGPNRMSYEQIMPVIEYTADRLTEIMTEAQKNMED